MERAGSMIEVAGFRYAVGRRTARAAKWVVGITGLSYALHITQAVLSWFGVSREIVVSTQYLFLISTRYCC